MKQSAASQMRSGGAEPAAQLLMDVAGTWHMRTMNLTGDNVLVTYDIVAKGQPSGWTLNLPDKVPIAMRVLEVSGDSIVTEAGPYASVLRENLVVTSRFVLQLREGSMEGILIAVYDTPEGRTSVPLRIEGVRAS